MHICIYTYMHIPIYIYIYIYSGVEQFPDHPNPSPRTVVLNVTL